MRYCATIDTAPLRTIKWRLSMATRTGVLVALVCALFVFGVPVSAQPMTSGFQGTVTAAGESVADGTVVSAWIDGTRVAEAETEGSEYSIFITGSYADKTVVFKVGRYQAEQTGTWTKGTTTTLDLSINSWPYQCEFFGEVTMDGQPVRDGTEISAWIDSARVQTTTTVDSMYSLIVPGNYTGKAVAFKVETYYATQIFEWKRGEAIEANLIVSLGPPVCGFYGTATLDGATPADGTAVTAWIDGKKVAETTISSGKYGLNIPGEYAGEEVSFKVGSGEATETVIWIRGGHVQQALTARTVGPVSVNVDVSASEVEPGEAFTITVNVDPNGHGISGGELALLMLDADVMDILIDEVTAGSLLGDDTIEGVKQLTEEEDYVSLQYAIARKGDTPLPTRAGVLATVGLRIKGGVTPGRYAIPNAITLTDENFDSIIFDPPIVSITVTPKLPGDLNADDTVGLADLAILASVYGLQAGETGYLTEADLNSNDEIDIGDLAILGGNWGQQRS